MVTRLDNRLDELGTCGRCGYKTYMCSCNSNALLDHDNLGKYGEEENDFKVYSEKFKNRNIILAPEKKKKKDSFYGDESDDEKQQRNGPKKIGMELNHARSVSVLQSHFILLP